MLTWTPKPCCRRRSRRCHLRAAVREPQPRRQLRPQLRAQLEWLWLTDPLAPGAGRIVAAPQVDLVQGEEITPLERLFAVADCANGIGSKIDIRSTRSSTPIWRCICTGPGR